MNRRDFIKKAGLGIIGLGVIPFIKLPEKIEAKTEEKEIERKEAAPHNIITIEGVEELFYPVQDYHGCDFGYSFPDDYAPLLSNKAICLAGDWQRIRATIDGVGNVYYSIGDCYDTYQVEG